MSGATSGLGFADTAGGLAVLPTLRGFNEGQLPRTPLLTLVVGYRLHQVVNRALTGRAPALARLDLR